MPTTGPGISPVKKSRPPERSLTIMVMGKLGKMRSFRVSRRLLFWAALFFAAYLPSSAYLLNRYFDLSEVSKWQKGQIERLEKDHSRSENTLARSKDHIVFLEEYIFQIENRAERASVQAAQQVDAKPQPKEAAATVSIEEVVLEKQGVTLVVNFKVVNLLPGDSTVGGYVHMTAKSEDGSRRLEWSYPQVRRIEGFPENYRRGHVFLIQRFKPIQAKLSVGSGPDAPTLLEILVYDQGGRIVLQKDFKIP